MSIFPILVSILKNSLECNKYIYIVFKDIYYIINWNDKIIQNYCLAINILTYTKVLECNMAI